jgi:hypothetical protein
MCMYVFVITHYIQVFSLTILKNCSSKTTEQKETKLLQQLYTHLIINFFSKTFEKVTYSRLNNHLHTNILVSQGEGYLITH